MTSKQNCQNSDKLRASDTPSLQKTQQRRPWLVSSEVSWPRDKNLALPWQQEEADWRFSSLLWLTMASFWSMLAKRIKKGSYFSPFFPFLFYVFLISYLFFFCISFAFRRLQLNIVWLEKLSVFNFFAWDMFFYGYECLKEFLNAMYKIILLIKQRKKYKTY